VVYPQKPFNLKHKMKERTTVFLLLLEELIKELNWDIEIEHELYQIKIDKTIIITPTIHNTWKIENDENILKNLSQRDAIEESVKYILIKRTDNFNQNKEIFAKQIKEAIEEWNKNKDTRYKSAIIENGNTTIPHILNTFEQYPQECNELLKIITGYIVENDSLEEWIEKFKYKNEKYSETSFSFISNN